jgi:hypothetical protein
VATTSIKLRQPPSGPELEAADNAVLTYDAASRTWSGELAPPPGPVTSDDVANLSMVNGGAGNVTAALDTLDADVTTAQSVATTALADAAAAQATADTALANAATAQGTANAAGAAAADAQSDATQALADLAALSTDDVANASSVPGAPTATNALDVLLALITASGLALVAMQVLGAGAGTYVATPGTRFALTVATGPGGNGPASGNSADSQAKASGGGGAGGSCAKVLTAADIGAGLPYVVGTPGNNTTLDTMIAGAGSNGSTAASAQAMRANGGAGGTATGGTVNWPGARGGDAWGFSLAGSVGAAAVAKGGDGAASLWGGPTPGPTCAVGSVTTDQAGNGVAGVAPGAGGSGGCGIGGGAGTAGTGANGQIVAYEFG